MDAMKDLERMYAMDEKTEEPKEEEIFNVNDTIAAIYKILGDVLMFINEKNENIDTQEQETQETVEEIETEENVENTNESEDE